MKFKVDYKHIEDINLFVDLLKMNISVSPIYWQNFKIGCSRHNFTFPVGETSIFVGVGMNSTKFLPVVTIDFNPNKVLTVNSTVYYEILKRVLRFCVFDSFKRFDVACDIPIARDLCYLKKDNRKYELHARSRSIETEYLGLRGVGRVKLYDKGLEMKQDIDLTRLEITTDYCSYENFLEYYPKVYTLNAQQEIIDFGSLSLSDKFLLRTLLAEPHRINEEFGDRKKRKKIETIFASYSNPILIPREIFNSLLLVLHSLLKS